MQQVLVQLLSSIKSMPLDSLIQTIHQVVKQPSLSQVITILSDLYIDVINICIIFLGRPTRYSN